MKQERVSSEGESRARSVAVVVLLAIVPVFAVVAFFAISENDGTSPERPRFASPSGERHTQERVPHEEQRARLPSPEGVPGSARALPVSRSPTAQEPSTAHDLVASTSPSAADEDAARLARFDQNARSFDERLSAFEREKGDVDEEAATALQEHLLSSLLPLHSTLQVKASCTLSVCVVEVSSEDPVGTMIARISPWLRQNTSLATGDPADTGDEHSLRLAFDKSELPVEF